MRSFIKSKKSIPLSLRYNALSCHSQISLAFFLPWMENAMRLFCCCCCSHTHGNTSIIKFGNYLGDQLDPRPICTNTKKKIQN